MIKNSNESETYIASMDVLVPLFKERLSEGQLVKFTPKGISMLPMLRQGIDTVTLAPINGKLRKYDIALYQRDNGKYVLHRIVKVGDTYTAIGDNQFIFEPKLREDQMIAVVSSFSRGKKEYSVNYLPYKIYCRLWHYSRLLRRIFRALKNRAVRIFRNRRS